MVGPRSLPLKLAPVVAHDWLALVGFLMVEPVAHVNGWPLSVAFSCGWPL